MIAGIGLLIIAFLLGALVGGWATSVYAAVLMRREHIERKERE